MTPLSPQTLALVGPQAPPDVRLAAARGEVTLPPTDRLAAIARLARDADPTVREAARARLL
ncbi:MAG TPA: hypothetical protein VNM66_06220, partial [Thermodesulfobacteriota bacterium]|nr:hypothetical protein [Thermodesulfobacteriota bacterium]